MGTLVLKNNVKEAASAASSKSVPAMLANRV